MQGNGCPSTVHVEGSSLWLLPVWHTTHPSPPALGAEAGAVCSLARMRVAMTRSRMRVVECRQQHRGTLCPVLAYPCSVDCGQMMRHTQQNESGLC